MESQSLSFSSLERSGLTREGYRTLGGSEEKETRRRLLGWLHISGETSLRGSSSDKSGEEHLILLLQSSGSTVSMESKLRLLESDMYKESLAVCPRAFSLVLC